MFVFVNFCHSYTIEKARQIVNKDRKYDKSKRKTASKNETIDITMRNIGDFGK